MISYNKCGSIHADKGVRKLRGLLPNLTLNLTLNPKCPERGPSQPSLPDSTSTHKTKHSQTPWCSRSVQLGKLQRLPHTSIALLHHLSQCGVSGSHNTQTRKYSSKNTCKTSTISTTSCTPLHFLLSSPRRMPVSMYQIRPPNMVEAFFSFSLEFLQALLTHGHNLTATAAYSLRAQKLTPTLMVTHIYIIPATFCSSLMLGCASQCFLLYKSAEGWGQALGIPIGAYIDCMETHYSRCMLKIELLSASILYSL